MNLFEVLDDFFLNKEIILKLFFLIEIFIIVVWFFNEIVLMIKGKVDKDYDTFL